MNVPKPLVVLEVASLIACSRALERNLRILK
jgi:hypothetical protein